jgi:hypothetical protein
LQVTLFEAERPRMSAQVILISQQHLVADFGGPICSCMVFCSRNRSIESRGNRINEVYQIARIHVQKMAKAHKPGLIIRTSESGSSNRD